MEFANNRTPEEHRAAIDAWKETAPENDSDIMPAARASSPRLGQLAEGLLAWLNRPAGIAESADQVHLNGDRDIAIPIATNWSIVPDPANDVPEDGFGVEARQEFTPSIEQIQRALSGVRFVYRKEPKGAPGTRKRKRETHAIPVDGDIDRNDEGAIVRLGGLEFSDGTQTERALVMGIDGKVVEGEIRLPLGAMLRCGDKSSRVTGPTSSSEASNAYFAEMLGTDRPRYKPGKRRRRTEPCTIPNPPLPPTSMSLNEARAFAGLPPAEKIPAGLPCGSPRVADSFLGMRKTTCGGGGSQGWEDILTGMVWREIWLDAMAEMKREHVEALDAATTAKTLSDVGVSVGYSRGHSKRGGKRALMAANDNIEAALKKSHAA